MFKRGQITIFIILGIVILIAVVFGIMMRKEIVKAVSSSEEKNAISFSEQSQQVKAHVEDCLEEALKYTRKLPKFTNSYLPAEQYNSELAKCHCRQNGCLH